MGELLAINLASLLHRSESQTLEWKRDFPRELAPKHPQLEIGKGTLLKDLAAMANGLVENAGYIVYGVADSQSGRQILGVSSAWDEASVRDWAANALYPVPSFTYSQYVESASTVVIIEVHVHPDGPHVARRSSGPLHEGQVPLRRGTQNGIANHAELRQMFRGPEPVASGSTSGEIASATIAHYKALDLETTWQRLADRDDRLHCGYRLALYPGTRRPVVVADPQTGRPDVILMIRPSKEGG
jgi:predicted HTH transcriptional regulator